MLTGREECESQSHLARSYHQRESGEYRQLSPALVILSTVLTKECHKYSHTRCQPTPCD
jgi:hypothetical protein